MGKLGRAIAGLGAVAGGYMQGEQMYRRGQREEEEAAARKADRDWQQQERDRVRQDQLTLRDAGRTAVVEPNITNDDDGNPTSAPALRMVGPGPVRNFDDRAQADAAALTLNDAGARRTRQAAALDAIGQPDKAIALESAAMTQGAAKRKEADDIWRQKVGTAMQGGHEGLAQLATQTEAGPLAGKKVKAVPSEDGKTVTYNTVAEDGTLTPTSLTFPNDQNGVIQAGYLMDRAITPEHRMASLQKDRELARKEGDSEARHEYQKGLIDNKIKQLELTGQIAEAKALAAAAKAQAGGGSVGREERIRYTSLFTDAGRRLGEAQKAMTTLTKDPDFNMRMKKRPDGPEAQQLSSLQADIQQYRDDRTLYQGLLAGSQSQAPSLAGAKPSAPAPKGGLAQPTSKAEYDKLPKGTRYIHPDGTERVKG